MDSGLAYVTSFFENFSEIYLAPLYMKAFPSYKVRIKGVYKALRARHLTAVYV